VRRIEVTLHGRSGLDRLFALEAALAALWPGGNYVLGLSPARTAAPTLGLRALDGAGSELVRAAYPLREDHAKRVAPAGG
jgi:hypothetical protein